MFILGTCDNAEGRSWGLLCSSGTSSVLFMDLKNFNVLQDGEGWYCSSSGRGTEAHGHVEQG